MKDTIVAIGLSLLASSTFATELDIDKYGIFLPEARTYTPAESCAKANEALQVLTEVLTARAEKMHACLQAQSQEKNPRPSSCPVVPVTHLHLQDYEFLREADCHPKRDPAYPRKTRAYRFLE